MRVFFKVLKLLKDLVQLPLPVFFLNKCLGYNESALLVYKVACPHASGHGAVYATPLSLEITLYLLQSVEGAHFLLRSFRGLGGLLG